MVFGQPRNDHQSAARARRAMPPPPDDDRAVDDASQALSELSTNVNDFLRMQAKVGVPSRVEGLPRREKTRGCRPHAGDAVAHASSAARDRDRASPRAARRRRAEQAAEPRVGGAGGAQGRRRRRRARRQGPARHAGPDSGAPRRHARRRGRRRGEVVVTERVSSWFCFSTWGKVCEGVVVHRGHYFKDSGRGIPSRPERELSSELHYSGVSRRGLFSKAIRLGLYTCILYVCIYIRIYIYTDS